jgi:hypothetical protein
LFAARPAQLCGLCHFAHQFALPDDTRMASRISFLAMIERLGDKAPITRYRATHAIRKQGHSCH